MLIADSQVHLWGANTPARPWPAGRDHEAQKPYPVTKDMLLFEMELAKVNRIVIVPPSWEGDRNDLALEAARLHPDKFAVMGRLNTTSTIATSSPTAAPTGSGRPPRRPASRSWSSCPARSTSSIASRGSTPA
jgi:hypothetical protein